jgi:phage tail-like protein
MAPKRDRPYSEFNFLVDLGTGVAPTDVDAGFQECSGIGMEVAVAEYRNGNERENTVRKIPGLTRTKDVTLRRGITGSSSLYDWIDAVRNGDATAQRDVTVSLISEDHTTVVATWRLLRARMVRYVAGPLDARGSEVAIEELTLAYERLEMEV